MMTYDSIDLLSKVNRELINEECCQILQAKSDVFPYPLQATSSDAPILHLSLDSWINLIEESHLTELVSDYDYLSLSICNPSLYSIDKLELIARYIGPKLLYLKLENCSSFTWKNHVKVLLYPANRIEILDLPKNVWLDDHAIDQIASKYFKTLRCIIFENCKISNDCLIQFGRRCVELKSLQLTYCPSIDDRGLIGLATKVRLTHIHISHNQNITDRGLIEFLSVSRQLMSLTISDCSNITDTCINNVFSSARDNNKLKKALPTSSYMQSLTNLELRANSNLTAKCLYAIASSSTSVRTLDLRESTGINLSTGLIEFEGLKHLRSLLIGPSHYPLQSETFTRSLLYHASTLTSLHLESLPDLKESDLTELIFESPYIRKLYLSEVSCGTATVEAIVNSIPDIQQFSIIGSAKLADKDVRCLTMICTQMKDFCVKRCSGISANAFSRVVLMKQLETLDISSCTSITNPDFINFASDLGITALAIDDLQIDFDRFIDLLKRSSLIHKLVSLSLQRCKLSIQQVTSLLNLCTRCQILNLTDVPIPRSSYDSCHISHPFLEYVDQSGFSGFEIPIHRRYLYDQFCKRIKILQKYHAGKLALRSYRRYRSRLEERKIERRQQWFQLRDYSATIIEKKYRAHKVYQKCRRFINAGRLMVAWYRRFLARHDELLERKANKHHRLHLLKKHFSAVFAFASSSRAELLNLSTAQITKHELSVKRKIILSMHQTTYPVEDQTEFHLYRQARVLWEEQICRVIIRHWKTILQPSMSSRHHQRKLLSIFNNCIDLSSHNSSRQLLLTNIAENFNRRRLLVIAWMRFCHDLIRIREVELLIPKATAHYRFSFSERVIRPVFHAMVQYRLYRKKKQEYQQQLMKRRIVRLKMKSFAVYQHFHRSKLLQRTAMKSSLIKYKQILAGRFFTISIPQYMDKVSHAKSAMNQAIGLHTRRNWRQGFDCWLDYFNRQQDWKAMNHRAKQLYRYQKLRSIFYAMHRFSKMKTSEEDELLEAVYHRYLLSICHRIIDAFKQNVNEAKAYQAQLEVEILARSQAAEQEQRDAIDEKEKRERMIKFIACIISIQSLFRGMIQRKRYHEFRVQSIYAALVIQRCIRRYLAVRRVRDIYRKRLLREQIREYEENDVMRSAEIESLYYGYLIDCIIKIQTAYRAFLGRNELVNKRIAHARYKSKKKYRDILKLRQEYEHYMRLATLREHNRQKAACTIQRVVRGFIARNIYLDRKRNVLKTRAVILIQAHYRRRLARQRLLAIIRDRAGQERFRAARMRRGYLLRFFGFKTRKVQHQLAKFMQFVGIDPLTYHYRLSEVIRETGEDFVKSTKQFLLEWKILRSNFIEKSKARRQFAIEGKYHFQVNDAVRIIEPEHVYFGYTGVIVRIDTTMPGVPLYEIKLDRYEFRQTYVKMTADPLLCYTNLQPLAHIVTKPKLKKLHYKTFFNLRPHDPFFKKSNVLAAMKIQQAYRKYRAIKTVARMRNEVWTRSAAGHNSLIHHLADNQSLTSLGHNFASIFLSKLNKKLAISEIQHRWISIRLLNRLKRSDEQKQLKEEYQQKYKERIGYLQKKALIANDDYFIKGYETLNTTRQIKLLSFLTYGLLMSRGVSLRDMFGRRAIDALRRKKVAVTGLKRYTFEQFKGSPHVRYPKMSIYQGEWTGIPLFTALSPHGEGLVMFFEAWVSYIYLHLYKTMLLTRHVS
jgi:hypothetical protein